MLKLHQASVEFSLKCLLIYDIGWVRAYNRFIQVFMLWMWTKVFWSKPTIKSTPIGSRSTGGRMGPNSLGTISLGTTEATIFTLLDTVGGCSSLLTGQTYRSGSMMANLVVPISQTVTTFTIQITTDIPLTSLVVSMIPVHHFRPH